jgi:hypothetical protein
MAIRLFQPVIGHDPYYGPALALAAGLYVRLCIDAANRNIFSGCEAVHSCPPRDVIRKTTGPLRTREIVAFTLFPLPYYAGHRSASGVLRPASLRLC